MSKVQATATIVITAADDAAVDEVYKALHPLIEGYPGRTIAIHESDRHLVRAFVTDESDPDQEGSVAHWKRERDA